MLDFSQNQKQFQKLTKPKAIIFDWDNTLVDTWPLIQLAINSTMEKFNRQPWSLQQVRDNIHKSMRDSFPEIFQQDWQQAGEIYRQSYQAINLNEIKFLAHSLDLIKTINQLNIKQFVVSNKIGLTLRKEIKKLAVEQYFFSMIGAFDANNDKPSSDPVELALLGSEIDLKNDVIWFIGDTIADVECAYNSNCQPIIYGHSGNQVSKTISDDIIKNGFKNNQIIPVYFDHLELINLLKNL
jgi:phosphoglycolate phosphatase